jgi:hypothetical protein
MVRVKRFIEISLGFYGRSINTPGQALFRQRMKNVEPADNAASEPAGKEKGAAE